MTPNEVIRAAIQQLLNREGDGWVLDKFVLALGLERMNSDGHLETSAWVWSPAEQADWITDGLLRAAVELRDYSESDVDDD